MRSFTAYGNDIGRCPRGTGEKGLDSDDEEERDNSDGEGGVRRHELHTNGRKRMVPFYFFEVICSAFNFSS